jgi:hypothetical protein
MEIYCLHINSKKYKQYKTYEEALLDTEKIIKNDPNLNLEIILEEYCEYGYLDTCCKTYLLYEYKNLIVKKYL